MSGESKNQKNLEPVKYTDEVEYYIIHRVLLPGESRFFLKLGSGISVRSGTFVRLFVELYGEVLNVR